VIDGIPDDSPEPAGEVPEDFVSLVRDALAHLYDLAHLQRHPLTRLIGPNGAASDNAKSLRNLLLDTLERLNPGDGVSRNDKEWRAYGILMRRYVDGFGIDEVGDELHISLRQLQREHRKGLLAAASVLWDRQRSIRAEPATLPQLEEGDLHLEVERLGLILARLDLCALVTSVLATAQALAEGRGVRLEVEPAGGPVWAWADYTLAKQALLAALSGLIGERPAALSILATDAPGDACLELRAEMPCPEAQEYRERLAAVTELMQAQGGQAEPLALPGLLSGLRLRFRRERGTRLLLVDDNERVLQLFERYLTAEGFLVSSAGGAEEALAAIAEERPEAIVLDVMMRNVDGWQFLQRLRANPELQDVPVVVCSVLNEPDLALALGAQGYLKKPVSHSQMLTALRQVLAPRPYGNVAAEQVPPSASDESSPVGPRPAAP